MKRAILLGAAAMLVLVAPADAMRPFGEGALPHLLRISLAGEVFGLPTREIPGGSWFLGIATGWEAATDAQLQDFVAHADVSATLDGQPLPLTLAYGVDDVPFCDPSDPTCLVVCPDGTAVPFCDDPAGCSYPFVHLVALHAPLDAGAHRSTARLQTTAPIYDGFCTWGVSDVSSDGGRDIVVTPRGQFPSGLYPPTDR